MPRPPDPSLTDALTGLSNDWHFRILLDYVFRAAHRGAPLTLVLFEIRDFEDYRATRGDDAADETLRDFGGLLASTTRDVDVAARLGPARFASALPDCNLQGGLILVDRMRRLARSLQEERGVTLATGVAPYEQGMEADDELLAAAEGALARSLREASGTVATSRDR